MELIAKKSLAKWNLSQNRAVLTNDKTKSTLANLSSQTDEELIRLFKKGNEQAFQIVLSRHHKPLFNFIYKFTRNKQAAEESFQEVFLRVIRSIDDYKPTAKFTTWLYTIARNYCIDFCRKEKFRNHLSIDQEDFFGQPKQFASKDPGSDQQIRRKEIQENLWKILDSLSLEQKEVFVMREYQGLPFDEIARITKTSTNTAKSRMRYALQAIKKEFVQLGITPLTH